MATSKANPKLLLKHATSKREVSEDDLEDAKVDYNIEEAGKSELIVEVDADGKRSVLVDEFNTVRNTTLSKIRKEFGTVAVEGRYKALNNAHLFDPFVPIWKADGNKVYYQTAWPEERKKPTTTFGWKIVHNEQYERVFGIWVRYLRATVVNSAETITTITEHGKEENKVEKILINGKGCPHIREIVRDGLLDHAERLCNGSTDFFCYIGESFESHLIMCNYVQKIVLGDDEPDSPAPQ